MAVDEFLETYKNSMLNKKIVNPLSGSNNGMTRPEFQPGQRPGFGASVPDWMKARKSTALNSYMKSKGERTTDIATQYSEKAAGQVPVDKYGIVQDKMTDFSSAFNQQLSSVNDMGKASLATEESKAQWQQLQNMQEMNAGFQVNYTPGASGDNPGARAVSLAMNAYNNKTPYVWGGNSLSKGIDCSGLVQQVYRQLGISVPRTTYEQAKSGKRVPLSNLLPGDLVFYNTGSQDPNGIGSLSHVAIYVGNGQIVDARNTRSGMKLGSINIMGGPVTAVRPW